MNRSSRRTDDHRIASVETWTCRFDLPSPLVFQDFEIRSREYVIARVTTTSGLEGVAYALSRSAPIAHVIEESLAPLIVGEDSLHIPRLLDRIERNLLLLGTEGIVQRAISLIDVCLWDIKAQAANLPLWCLLGGLRTEASTLLVDCYPQSGDHLSDVIDGLAARAEEGYRALKIHCLPNAEATRLLLAAARDALGPDIDLVLDAGMAFRDPLEAIRAIRSWAAYAPAWVEDPFRAERAAWIRRVRAETGVPIGAGDEVANPDALRSLVSMGAVDVVRLDALVHGGLTGFASLAAHAVAEGIQISPHVYPEIHQHCVFAFPGTAQLEVFALGTEYDCAEAFVKPHSLVRPVHGRVSAPERPGLGLELDWNAVQAHAVST